MKIIIKIVGTTLETEASCESKIYEVCSDIISGTLEVPDLTEYFRKRFENEAKAWEYQNMVKH